MDTDPTNPVEDGDTSAEEIATFETGVEQDEAANDDLADDEADNPDEPGPEEDEEVELDDVKLRLPKSQAQKVREAMLRQADYTRKTQALADERKAFEAGRQAVQQATQQEQALQAAVLGIDAQIQNYQNVDWAGEEQRAQARLNAAMNSYDQDAQNVAQAEINAINAEWRRFESLKQQRGQMFAQYAGLVQQRNLAAQQETARSIEEGRAQLARDIPAWNDELKAKLTDFAAGYGFSREELADLEADPRVAKVLHAAFEGTDAKRKATVARAQQVQPATTLKGTSGSPTRADTRDFSAFERMANKARA